MAKAPLDRSKRGERPPKQAIPTKSKPKPGDLPTKDAVLEALKTYSDLTSKRDLTRYFGIKGDNRAPFKALIREMENEGLLSRKRKSLRRAADLPSVSVLDIPAEADPDKLIGFPANWDESDGKKPEVHIVASKGDRVVPGPGNRILARVTRQEDGEYLYTAKPMKILERPRRAQIGIVRMDDDGARLVPIDRKQNEMRIAQGDLGEAQDGDLVEVTVKVSGRMMLQRAQVIGVLGNPKSEGAVSMIALHNLEIPYRFPPEVDIEATAIEEVGIKGREDWRDIPFVTIDPASAKDHDDAVFAEPDPSPDNVGGNIVYVAIADVAAYITPGSILDREAYVRGNSVYFPDRVVPMLPERISNDLCSLREGQNRPSMAARMVFNAEGRKISHSFHRVVIKSAAKLSYEQAQAAFDGKTDDATAPLLEGVLKPLWAAYATMAAARDKRGPLALDLPEKRIELNEDGTVSRIFVPPRLEAHRLIEEMMVAANVAAAEELNSKQAPVLFRVHDTPGPEKLAALRDFLSTMDYSFTNSDAVRPSHFNQILSKAAKSNSSGQVSDMILRTQARAEYSAENYGHFGLHLDNYAHFTSPIRRYADLVVHRSLINALNLGDDGLASEDAVKLPGIAQHISSTERRAMAAERETTDRLVAGFMSEHIGASFQGRVAGVTRSGLFVRLNESGADGFIPISTLGRDYFVYDENQQAVIGERTGERFRLGDAIEVRLLEAAPMAGALRFEVLSEGQRVSKPTGRGRNPRRSGASKQRRRR